MVILAPVSPSPCFLVQADAGVEEETAPELSVEEVWCGSEGPPSIADLALEQKVIYYPLVQHHWLLASLLHAAMTFNVKVKPLSLFDSKVRSNSLSVSIPTGSTFQNGAITGWCVITIGPVIDPRPLVCLPLSLLGNWAAGPVQLEALVPQLLSPLLQGKNALFRDLSSVQLMPSGVMDSSLILNRQEVNAVSLSERRCGSVRGFHLVVLVPLPGSDGLGAGCGGLSWPSPWQQQDTF